MFRTILIPVLVVCAMIVSGCGSRNQLEELTARLDETRQEVANLAAANRSLEQEIAALKAPRVQAAANAVPLGKEAASQFMSILASNINAMVAAQIDERIGSTEDIDAIMAETVQDELAAAEARKEEEQQKRREKWRQEAEKRRKDWEDSQTAKLTEELDLNEEQQERIKAANEQMRAEMRESMQNIRSGGDWTSIGTTIAEIRQSNNDRMKEIMNEEQYSSYTNRQTRQMRSVMDLFGGAMRGLSGQQTQ